jgi:oxalate decarboxylase
MSGTHDKPPATTLSRRRFLGAASSSALAAAAFAGRMADAQKTGPPSGWPASDPGPVNQPLLVENPGSNAPPPTDHGDTGPVWYSFNLAHKRVEAGGWTRQVTARELPSSRDIAGVNMRLNAGSFRELHWHTAGEWALMLSGSARVSVFTPDGRAFIDDVCTGDLWFFPGRISAFYPELAPDGCEFLLVFDEGLFSEENTFLLSEWMAHTPPQLLERNLRLDSGAVARLPHHELFIFSAPLPGALSADRAVAGGPGPRNAHSFTFRMSEMDSTVANSGGSVRIVDSRNFPASATIAAAQVTPKPGGLRELHWHPNSSEWQFYVQDKGRMTVFEPPGRARTMDFNANDVGFVPAMAGHYIENTGDKDLIFLEILRADRFVDFSLNNWLRHLPQEMVQAHLNLDSSSIQEIPSEKLVVIAGEMRNAKP